TLGQQIAEAGEGHGGSCSAPLHQPGVDPESTQNHPGHHIGDQDAGGGEGGLVNENLPDEAEGSAAEKDPGIGPENLHGYTSLSDVQRHRMADGGDALPLLGG